jgi:hypothetical protein
VHDLEQPVADPPVCACLAAGIRHVPRARVVPGALAARLDEPAAAAAPATARRLGRSLGEARYEDG